MKRVLRHAVSLAAPLLWKKFFHGRPPNPWLNRRIPVTISFDPDYPEDVEAIPKLLELFGTFGWKTSFACIGRWVEKYPRIHHAILDQGHEIINHTFDHPNNELLNSKQFFNKLSEKEQEEQIAGFEATAKKILDYTPVGFRSPHFGDLHTQSVYAILERRGYTYSSSTHWTVTNSQGRPYRPSKTDFHRKDENNGYRLLELPMASCPRHYFPVFDTWHCYRTQPPAHPKAGQFKTVFQEAVTLAQKNQAYANFYFDPRDVVDNPDFEESLVWLKNKDVSVGRSDHVAAEWAKTNGKRTEKEGT